MDHLDVLTAALALGQRGYPVFPCRSNKKPATPGGGNGGFHFASTNPPTIRDLFRDYPGELIGVRTGEASGRSVLDVDPSGLRWLRANYRRIPTTRTFQTRRNGMHLWMQHPPGLRCSQGLVAPGIDVRADGGYAIHWFAAGLPCLDPAPEAPWPRWLQEAATRSEAPPRPEVTAETSEASQQTDQFSRYEQFAAKVLDRLAGAPLGEKHSRLLATSRAIGGIRVRLGWSESYALRQLLQALPDAGPNAVADWEGARKTAIAGLQDGAKRPLVLADRPYDREIAA